MQAIFIKAIINSFPVEIYGHYCKTGQNNYFGNEIHSEVKPDEEIKRRMQKSSVPTLEINYCVNY
jgi:hypothetical protein